MVLASFLWLLISLKLSNAFIQLSTDDLLDLSKTLIQSVGILVSLIIVAFFYYVGKIDSLMLNIYSKQNDLETKKEKIRDELAIMEKSIREFNRDKSIDTDFRKK